jgi:hypothetical protein
MVSKVRQMFTKRPNTPLPGRRVRPMVESLEDRLLPSTFIVTDLGDTGAGSGLHGDLRYAVTTANSNADPSNRIVFHRGLAGTIILTHGPLVITKNLAMDGPGADLITVSGNHESGVFEVPPETPTQDVQIADLTVADGAGVFYASGPKGGGFFNWDDTVTLTRVTVTGNAVGGGSSHGEGGGIYNVFGSTVLNSCTVSDNQANPGGSFGGSYGGIDNANGTMTLNNCLVSGNTAAYTGGVGNLRTMNINHSTISGNSSTLFGGGIGNDEMLTVTDSQIVDNVSTSFGGGIDNNLGWVTVTDSLIAGNTGGGIRNSGSMSISGSTIAGNTGRLSGGGIMTGPYDLNISNSTISGNTTDSAGGGIYAQGVFQGNVYISPSVELTSTTITLNTARATGGGIWVHVFQNNHGRIFPRNTIVAGNSTAGSGPDVNGPVLSLGYNLVGQTDGSTGWVGSDDTGSSTEPLDPRLSPLRDNGGPTPTHAVLVGSPAIAAGDPGLGYTLDQRGTPRSFVLYPDVGAFQAQSAVSFGLAAPAQVVSGEPFEVTVTALDSWGHTASTYTGTVHFTSSDPHAALPDDYTFAASDGGQQTFSVQLQTASTQTITAYDVANILRTGSATVDVTDGLDPGKLSAVSGAPRGRRRPRPRVERHGQNISCFA